MPRENSEPPLDPDAPKEERESAFFCSACKPRLPHSSAARTVAAPFSAMLERLHGCNPRTFKLPDTYRVPADATTAACVFALLLPPC